MAINDPDSARLAGIQQRYHQAEAARLKQELAEWVEFDGAVEIAEEDKHGEPCVMIFDKHPRKSTTWDSEGVSDTLGDFGVTPAQEYAVFSVRAKELKELVVNVLRKPDLWEALLAFESTATKPGKEPSWKEKKE